jgi:hypothetical protein
LAAATGHVAGNLNDDVFIGGDPDYTIVGSNERYFAGAIAQAAFFTNALTAAQVGAIFAAGTQVPPPETLAVKTLDAGHMQLNWNYGTLQSATNVSGPYRDLIGAAAPYTVTLTNAQQFYRVKEY